MENNKKINKKKIKRNNDNLSQQQKADRKEIKRNEKKAKKKNKKIGWKIFKIALISILALGIIGAGVVFGVVSGIIDETDTVDLSSLSNQARSSIILDKDGNQIQVLQAGENRLWVEFSDIPKNLVNAVIAIEDQRFYTHNGVDIKRTAGAIMSYILGGGDSDFGASTITQQLVKNITKDKETSWKRKVREWYRAYSLETQLDKETIMGYYLNTVYLGANAHGVKAASYTYFNKNVSDLNLAEAACLAAQIQTPGETNPYVSDEAKQRLFDRQKLVLSEMLKQELITQEEYDDALKTDVAFEKGVLGQTTATTSYYVDAVIEAVIQDLMQQKGIDENAAELLLYTGGFTIYSNLDPEVMRVLNASYGDPNLFYYNDDGTFMQSATVVIDQSTGKVLGVMGGADEKKGSRTFNRATQAQRQPGSCMKPIGAYGPAVELGLISAPSGLDDSEFVQGNYRPGNYYGYFNGFVTMREAIAKSMNIPALRACSMAGTDYAFNFARNCGLTSLTDTDKNIASLALGGITNGPTPLQMASAYATIANGGIYITPTFYTEVKDKNGEVVLKPETEAKRVMKETTAYILNSCLQTVVTSGTATGNVNVVNGIQLAGKTGNTNNDYDQWFIGFSPYYTIACWNGYDVNREIGWRKIIDTYPYNSLFMWNRIQQQLHENKPAASFTVPAGIVSASVCRDSGKIATDACRKDPRGSREITDIFASGAIPTDTCTVHKEAEVCTKTGKLAGQYCEKTTRSFITRDGPEPNIKSHDWGYMMPKETCTECKKPEPVKPATNDVDIYTDTKTNTNTKDNKVEIY